MCYTVKWGINVNVLTMVSCWQVGQTIISSPFSDRVFVFSRHPWQNACRQESNRGSNNLLLETKLHSFQFSLKQFYYVANISPYLQLTHKQITFPLVNFLSWNDHVWHIQKFHTMKFTYWTWGNQFENISIKKTVWFFQVSTNRQWFQ